MKKPRSRKHGSRLKKVVIDGAPLSPDEQDELEAAAARLDAKMFPGAKPLDHERQLDELSQAMGRIIERSSHK